MDLAGHTVLGFLHREADFRPLGIHSAVLRLKTFLLNFYPVFEQFVDEFTRGVGVLVRQLNYLRFQTPKPLDFSSRQTPASSEELGLDPLSGCAKK